MPRNQFMQLGSPDFAALAELLALTTEGKLRGYGPDATNQDEETLGYNLAGERARFGLNKALSPGQHYDATRRADNERVSTESRGKWPHQAGPQPDWWSGSGPYGDRMYGMGTALALRDKLLAMLSSK